MSEVDLNEGLRQTQSQIKQLNGLTVALVVVLFLGFITLLFTVVGIGITYQHDNAEAFNDYKNEIRAQNDKIDKLTNTIENQERQAK